jgi:RecA-family ATPase
MNLPTVRAHRLAEQPQARRWLIDELWADEAVGIVGGEPKCCKSFLALDMAVSVAGGVPCLRRFASIQTGRVLLFAAEDALHVVRQRLAGIALAAGRSLADLDIHVITAPSVRLDVERDRDALVETIAELRPKLLVLDPFVRLHRIDENLSGEVAPLLAYLRELQRRFHVAVVLVHHARKGGAKMRLARRCAARANSTPGATRTSTCAATVNSSRSRWSIGPRPRSQPSRSSSRSTATRSRSRPSSARPPPPRWRSRRRPPSPTRSRRSSCEQGRH